MRGQIDIGNPAPHGAYPLYDPRDVRAACGVGFVTDRSTVPSHRLVRLGVECLENLDHRGAKSADGTGDGAGMMTRVPHRFLARHLSQLGITSPPALGVVVAFLPPARLEEARRVIEQAVAREGLPLLTWRTVPVNPDVLSAATRSAMPRIEQAIVAAPDGLEPAEVERRLYLARRAVEAVALEGLSIPSASSQTVVYKGLFTAAHIGDFYPDLEDPDFETDFAVFHQRYSTNTAPTWEGAQPFRILAHNGEINTIRANRSWMVARSNDLRSSVWGDRVAALSPLVSLEGSDSASLDQAFEVLVKSGRSPAQVKEMLIPAAWENMSDLDPAVQGFHAYHSFLSEPWDGPAAIVACDGSQLLAGLDRNGLRPLRWTITATEVIAASEAGVAPDREGKAEATGQLGPGEMLLVDLRRGGHAFSGEVRRALAGGADYATWIRTETNHVQDPFDELQDDRFDPDALARIFGYTAEERRLILQPMTKGLEPGLSMGNDTGLAVLAEEGQRLTRFFHQAFAQVTNPPMDPIRERLVMSLHTHLGRRGSILEETPQQAHLIELPSPVLSDAELEKLRASPDPAFRSVWLEALIPTAAGPSGLRSGLGRLCEDAETAVREGAAIVIISDRETDAEHAPIPIVLAVGAVHHRLIDAGLRLHASIVAVSGEPRDAHDLACLIGFGAAAVNPYLAIEQVRAMAEEGAVTAGVIEAQENYRRSLDDGLLKIMSKMGICTVSAYQGSELFEAIGLDENVCQIAFRFASHRIGGIGLDEIGAAALQSHQRYVRGGREIEGYYKHRRGGQRHINAPRVVLALHRAVRSGDWEDWLQYLDLVGDRPPMELRDLLRIEPAAPAVHHTAVESPDRIVRRFTTAGMSLGAMSTEAHETLAVAMNYLGGLSNSGEGGEDPDRFGTGRNSSIKQVASGRFGVTPGYLASAEEFQIKMAQGSKPGEGGQLPGHKVSVEIAHLRHTDAGVTLISPPPHHDIYSIEDLAQLIHDLKAFKPHARVSVKLAAGPGVGTIAVGVAKAQADALVISGNAGGTGASPLVSIKHAGSPWEIGVAEAHQSLVASGLRRAVSLETDGGLRTGRDVVIAALLGADRFGFGTLPLMALGCKMVRQCHENTCPMGIATQRPDLRAKFRGTADDVVRLFTLLAHDIRQHLAQIGAVSIDEILGRGDLLEAADPGHPVAGQLAGLFVRARPSHTRRYRRFRRSAIGEALRAEVTAATAPGARLEIDHAIRNQDRAVGTGLAGAVAELRGDRGLDPGSVTIRLRGTAGHSLGAFLVRGLTIDLAGAANDFAGKGMGGGVIVIRPTIAASGTAQGAGNACLYGATGGALFIAGSAGQRFAVRNSGATAVVEGTSDHCCEYMTGGKVVVLGPVGRNLAAGMTGGAVYVWDPDMTAKACFATTAPPSSRIEDGATLQALLAEHVDRTGSATASAILERWSEARRLFWVLRPTRPNPRSPRASVGERAFAVE